MIKKNKKHIILGISAFAVILTIVGLVALVSYNNLVHAKKSISQLSEKVEKHEENLNQQIEIATAAKNEKETELENSSTENETINNEIKKIEDEINQLEKEVSQYE